MSYSRRELYAMGEPFGDCATERKIDGRYICGLGGGGGGGQPANTTQQITQELPAWARPYAKESLAKASALADSPYQTYGGERIAQFSPLQQGAFGRAEGQQVAGQIGFGTGLAGMAGTSSFSDPNAAASFMSPYMQQVVDQQMSSAQRQADIASTQRGAQAVRAGAFGGSRQAIENAEAARALASQKGQIQTTGLQSAFERAQQQFNQEQATRINAAQALGQLGQQQFGQQMGITEQQAQFGQQQRAATQDILNQQYQDFQNQQRAPYDQLAFMTSMIRGTPMGGTTAQYSTAPAPSMTSQLIGLGTAAAGAYGAYQGSVNQAGRGSAKGGEVKSYAAGGIASLNQPEMAAMAGRMSDQQLGRTAQMPSITDLAKMTLAAEAQQRAQMREDAMQQQAMMAQQPQGTVAEEQMAAIDAMDQGLGGLEVRDDLVGNEYTAAGGGIVAFSNLGAVPEVGNQYDMAKAAYEQSLENLRRYGGRQKLADPAGYAAAENAVKQAEQALEAAKGSWDRASQGMAAPAVSRSQMGQGVNPALTTAQPVTAIPTGGIAGDNRAALNRADAGIRSMPALTEAEKAAQVATTTKPPAPSAAPGAAPRDTGPGAAPSMPSGGLAGLLKDMSTREAQLRDEAKQASDLELAGLEKERTALEAAKEEAKKYGTEQEEKYKKRGERLDKAEKGNIYQTMIEAGLAIAAGESPNALKNIAVGAQQGLKGYQARLDKVNEGRDGLEDAMFKLYNIRNDKITAAGDKLRELGRAETKAKADAVRSLSEISKGMFGEEIKLKTKQIDQMFEMSKTRFEQGQATERARMTADRGDPVLRRAAYQGLQKELENNQRLLMAYSNNPEKAEAARQEIRRIKGEMDALLPGVGSSAGAGSGTVDMKNPLLGP